MDQSYDAGWNADQKKVDISGTVSRRGVSKPVILSAIVVLGIVAAGLVWWIQKPAELTSAKAVELVQVSRDAIAHLENEVVRDGFEQAEKLLLQLKKELPEDLFAYRNEVILRILQVQADPELANDESFVERTTDLINELIEKEPQQFEPYILATRWKQALLLELTLEDLELFETACTYANGSPVPHFEFTEAATVIGVDSIDGLAEKRLEHLNKAYQLQKDNLKLSLSLLIELAEAGDYEAFQTIWKEFENRLKPIVLAMDREKNDTLRNEYIGKIEAALKSDQPETIVGPIRILWNLVKSSELQQIDQARIRPHELEMLATSLGPDVLAKAEPSIVRHEPPGLAFQAEEIVKLDQEIRDVRFIDFDLDERLEIVVLTDAALLLLDRESTGDAWAERLKVDLTGSFNEILIADLDYDTTAQRKPIPKKEGATESGTFRNYADPDLILVGESGCLVLENQYNGGQRRLEPAESGDLADVSGVTAACLVDIDHDKDLDLVLSSDAGVKVMLARGNLSFFDYTSGSSFPQNSGLVTDLRIVDWDRDIDIDILMSCQSGAPILLENVGHGSLRFRELDSFSTKSVSAAMAVELDGIPSWDWVSIGSDGINLATSQTANSNVTPVKQSSITASGQSELLSADFNNDGFVDVIAYGNEQPTLTILGDNTAQPEQGADLNSFHAADDDDEDEDGRVDLVIATGKSVQILRNISETQNNWLEFYVRGISSNFPKGRINNFAIGSFVELKVGNRYQAQTVDKPRLHFGLGQAKSADLVRFLWTSGMPQSLIRPQAGQVIYEEMFEKGSCPYIYTWEGTRYRFFSDCLWAAPLGLQYAPGKLIPCRNWEYLKIPGEFLRSIDGEYRLQLTEELREAAYFDEVRLFAIDHPADVQVFTNEKVGPPFIAEHKIHTVTDPLMPRSATDMFGNDVLPQIRNVDQDYFKGFKQQLSKGLTPLHYIELDFGELESTDNMTLFLNGWIRPTDCSLNISFSQNPDEPGPEVPVILAPDENGQWQKTIDPMGFPGGKPKTIAVDISNAFLCKDRRIRIQTSHEIYWDQIFYTLGEPTVEIKKTELKLRSADLNYRGFSKRLTPDPLGPEVYDYDQVTSSPRWPAMRGAFTRYGDVKELLTEKDDRSVVLGSGDQITVSFDGLEDPAEGWERDFVIYLVGYDKDGDLNTLTGQSSEPLPFDGMKSYPYGPDDPFPNSVKHQKYLQKYQTRRQSPGSFWNSVSETD